MVVVDWVYAWLALDLDVKGTMIISLMDANRVSIIVNSDEGFESILESRVISIVLNFIDEVINLS